MAGLRSEFASRRAPLFPLFSLLIAPTLSLAGSTVQRALEATRDRHWTEAEPVDLESLRLSRADPRLIDPAALLPSSQRFPQGDLGRFAHEAGTCNFSERAYSHSELERAARFERARCRGLAPSPGFYAQGNPIHPFGGSYAARARAMGFPAPESRLHLLETDALADLSADGWQALLHGESAVLSPRYAWASVIDARGIRQTRRIERARWEKELNRQGWRVEPAAKPGCGRIPGAGCLTPTSASAWPWQLLALTLSALVIWVLGRALMERRRLRSEQTRAFQLLAHEIRTPLSALTLELEGLRACYDSLPPAAQRHLLALADSLARLTRVVETSRAWIRASRPSKQARFDLAETARRAIETIVGEVPADSLPPGPIWTLGDPTLAETAVRILCENAREHGRPPFSVRAYARGGYTIFEVADHGEGLRAKPPHARGLGIGLELARQCARRMRGRIRSERAGGVTRFSLELRGVP